MELVKTIEIRDWTEEGLQQLFQLLKQMKGLTISIGHQEPKKIQKEMSVSQLLADCRIAPNLKGHRYIKTAIEMCLEDRNVLDGITKRLYPEIARKYNVDCASVEHGIRHAVSKAWDIDHGEYMRQFFGNSLRNQNKRPTNSEFIATFADYMEYNLH